MKPRGGARPNSGRKPGIPNKGTIARRLGLDAVMDRTGYDPMEALILEAQNSPDLDFRVSIAKFLMPYVYIHKRDDNDSADGGGGARSIRLVVE